MLAQVRLNHPQLVRGWFTDLELADISGAVLLIQARNGAQKRYLDQHCLFALREAAQASTGRLVAVEVEAAEDASEAELKPAGFGEPLQLNPDYLFENFITGPSNRLAHAASVAVSDDLGRAYNPLFLHSSVGLGKTHLLQAICHTVKQRDPEAKILYLSCETFINHFIEAVEQGALNLFRYRYRHVECLVIDDVQFLAERERSQEEFFHTFNTLHQSQRQVILTADCPPVEIPSLEERLVSRFNSGLVAMMERPCLETRMSIVSKKAKLRCIEAPEDVIRLIASRIDTNIRDLEGALIKVDALSQTCSGPITLELAKQALGPGAHRPVKVPAILEVVAKRFNVKVSDLQGKKRTQIFTKPRHLSMYLARMLTSESYDQIGGYFGNRDHSTVLHASRSVTTEAARDPELRELLSELALEARNVSI